MDADREDRELLWELVRDIFLDAEHGRVDLPTAMTTLEAVVREWTRA